MKYIFKIVIVLVLLLILIFDGYAQEKKELLFTGKVFSSVTKKPVDFCTVVVVEARKKVYTGSDGSFALTLPEKGEYTVIIRSSGLKILKIKLKFNKDLKRDFRLQPLKVKGRGLTIYGERDIQKLSRHTMTVQDLKSVPGSFGDAINALTVLPGVIRAGGFFGPLTIRGSDFISHNYLIDDLPVFSPMHYGGLHAVINNNIMSEIDLYASAFPVQYGSATGAVIDINTLDEVKEFDGYTDLGLLSASFLFMSPFYSDEERSFNIAGPSYRHDPDKNDKKGYFIASARYGYFTLALKLVDLLISDAPSVVPEYWDYQVKLKYYLGRFHSLSMLFFGSSDYLKLGFENDEEKARKEQEYNDDPLLLSIEFKTDQQFITQGLYYTFEPSKRFQNTLMAYASLNRIRQYIFFEGENFPEALNGININADPDIFGLKNRTRAEWWENHGEIRIGLEYTFYKFMATGKSLYIYEGKAGQGAFQRGETDELFYTYELNEDIENKLIGGYIENKFTFGGLQIVPGFRSDYLDRSRVSTLDPRYRLSYEFPFETTLSASYGHFSYFFQVNPRNFNSNLDLAKLGSILKPERAIHRVVGLEQRIDLFTIKVETFLNDFFDRPRQFPHTEADGTFLPGLSSGRLETRGFEFLLRKDRREKSDGLFGWLSYTYTRAREKSNLPVEPGYAGIASNPVGDPYGDRWVTSPNEQIHSMKITSGYIYGRSTFSAKFQLYTGRPYTPITASEFDEEYYMLSGVSRYLPIYGERNSARYDMFHQLDVRYSFKTFYSWGYVSWYIEVINVYNNIQKNQQNFDKTRPYQDGVNPVLKKPDTSLSLFPGFGVEIKF